jgi:hypothetical protein
MEKCFLTTLPSWCAMVAAVASLWLKESAMNLLCICRSLNLFPLTFSLTERAPPPLLLHIFSLLLPTIEDGFDDSFVSCSLLREL